MPIYTYACTACGADVERRAAFSDPRLTVCEVCGGALRRLLHPVGVIFKGSGFYNTDNKKNSGNGAGNGSDGSTDKAKDGGSDAKPTDATKSEPSKSDTPAAPASKGEPTTTAAASTAKA